ncbi:MAG: hypothetical protein K8F60_02600 [Melioribacteraceae bacterium]|nr:hypothetical protein [Melioribacteraceae bacterium]
MSHNTNRIAEARANYRNSLRRVSTLEKKIAQQTQVISSRSIVKVVKKDQEVLKVKVALTPAQLEDERRKLEELKTEKAAVKTELKYSRFNFKKETQKQKVSFRKARVSLYNKEAEKKNSRVITLLRAASNNGLQKEVNSITKKLSNNNYTDKEFKKELIPILNKYNRSIPITSLSKDTVDKIKEIMKNNN